MTISKFFKKLVNIGSELSGGEGAIIIEEVEISPGEGSVIINDGSGTISTGDGTTTVTANVEDIAQNIFVYSTLNSNITISSAVNLYNFGQILPATEDAVTFNAGGFGKILNFGVIDGNVSVSDDHEGDYVILIDNNATDGGSVTELGDSEFSTTMETNQIFGLLDGDNTNHITGNVGTEGNDIIEGDETSQTISGLEGDDWILGKEGDDILLGGSGEDVLSGGAGDDSISGGADNDVIGGGTGNDLIGGGAGFDIVGGGDGNDRIFGGDGNDILSGENGNDVIFGGAGNDRIQGDAGKDLLFGGEGEDTFVFTNLSHSEIGSSDIIFDFEQGIDKIDLFDIGITSFSELSVSNIGDWTTISTSDTGNDFTIQLSGSYSLLDTDFVFAS